MSWFLKGGPGTSPEVTRADSPGGSFDLCKVLHTRVNCPILQDEASGPSGPRTAARSRMGPCRARPARGRHTFLSRAVELTCPPPGGPTGSWGSSRRFPLPPSMTCSRWQVAILTALGLGVNLAALSHRGSLLWETLSPLATLTQLSPSFRLPSPLLCWLLAYSVPASTLSPPPVSLSALPHL